MLLMISPDLNAEDWLGQGRLFFSAQERAALARVLPPEPEPEFEPEPESEPERATAEPAPAARTVAAKVTPPEPQAVLAPEPEIPPSGYYRARLQVAGQPEARLVQGMPVRGWRVGQQRVAGQLGEGAGQIHIKVHE